MSVELPFAQRRHLDVPFGPSFQTVRCLSPDRCVIASFDGEVVVAFRRGHTGLFRMVDAAAARNWAADLLRAADDVDQGKGKQ